jgi:hypothetical protein
VTLRIEHKDSVVSYALDQQAKYLRLWDVPTLLQTVNRNWKGLVMFRHGNLAIATLKNNKEYLQPGCPQYGDCCRYETVTGLPAYAALAPDIFKVGNTMSHFSDSALIGTLEARAPENCAIVNSQTCFDFLNS